MLYYRPHRGALEDATKELKKFDTFTQLLEHFHEELKPWNFDFTDEAVSITPYVPCPDKRIGWPDTWLAVIRGYGVIGYVTHKG